MSQFQDHSFLPIQAKMRILLCRAKQWVRRTERGVHGMEGKHMVQDLQPIGGPNSTLESNGQNVDSGLDSTF